MSVHRVLLAAVAVLSACGSSGANAKPICDQAARPGTWNITGTVLGQSPTSPPVPGGCPAIDRSVVIADPGGAATSQWRDPETPSRKTNVS